MRAVVQRVSSATVTVDGDCVAAISRGLLVLVGVTATDTAEDAVTLAGKLAGLRVFADESDRLNRSVTDVAGSVLVVSQFTLYGSTRKGRRPSFTSAADPQHAEPLVDEVVRCLRLAGIDVVTGRFGARMDVSLVNEGPVTLLIEVAGGSVL